MSLADALERAASALPELADAIRPANGDPHGLADALDDAGAARVLDWLLANEPDAADQLADEWLDLERGRAALAALDEAALSKAGRKVLRRARHRLRSRGVALPAAPAPPPMVATLPSVDEPLRAAFVSNADPRGSVLVYLVEPHPSGGARIFEVVADGLRGIVGFDVYEASRGGARRFMKDLPRRSSFAVVEVEMGEARALVAAAAAAQPAAHPLPRGFEEWRARVAGEPSAPPGARVRAALGDEDTPGLRHAAAELVRRGEIGPWPPPREQLSAAAEQVKSRAEGVIVVSDARKHEQIASAVDDAAVSVFDASFAAVTADRFEHAAFVLWKKGREDDARACLAAASAFRKGEVADNPAARAMLEVVLAPLLTGGGEPPPEERPPDEEPRLLAEP